MEDAQGVTTRWFPVGVCTLLGNLSNGDGEYCATVSKIKCKDVYFVEDMRSLP